MRPKDMIRLVTPPVFVNLARRLRTPRESLVEWEYVPDGWAYAETHPEVKGWNAQDVLETYKGKWPLFARMVEGTGPLGVAHESALDTNEDVLSHNIVMTFGYALALAARDKKHLSLLDWGGGIGHYFLLARALLPEVEIEYHCKDVPLLSEHGARLFPEQHFYSDESCLDNAYDFVLASTSLHYTEDWRTLLHRLSRCDARLFVYRQPTDGVGSFFLRVCAAALSLRLQHRVPGLVPQPDGVPERGSSSRTSFASRVRLRT